MGTSASRSRDVPPHRTPDRMVSRVATRTTQQASRARCAAGCAIHGPTILTSHAWAPWHLTCRANQRHIDINIVEPAPETAAGFYVSQDNQQGGFNLFRTR